MLYQTLYFVFWFKWVSYSWCTFRLLKTLVMPFWKEIYHSGLTRPDFLEQYVGLITLLCVSFDCVAVLIEDKRLLASGIHVPYQRESDDCLPAKKMSETRNEEVVGFLFARCYDTGFIIYIFDMAWIHLRFISPSFATFNLLSYLQKLLGHCKHSCALFYPDAFPDCRRLFRQHAYNKFHFKSFVWLDKHTVECFLSRMLEVILGPVSV